MGGHRAVVVEIPHHSLLGEKVLKVVCLQARRLKCSLTGPKFRYLQKCKTLFQEHNVYSKARGIYISARYTTPPWFTEKLHKLDKEMEKYTMNAEKKYRKMRMGGVDFSP